MTKVIKGEFEKINNVKVKDVLLTCDTPLKVFNNEVSRLSRMDDDSKHEPDDDMGAFNEFNYLLQIHPNLLTNYIEGLKTYKDYKNDWNGKWMYHGSALEDSELKDKALRNKAIMDEFMNDDDVSRYEQKKQWNISANYDDAYEINHDLVKERLMNIGGESTNLEITKCWSLEPQGGCST
nr:hypothetical protein [Tanacetum cinerariifolium]